MFIHLNFGVHRLKKFMGILHSKNTFQSTECPMFIDILSVFIRIFFIKEKKNVHSEMRIHTFNYQHILGFVDVVH